MFPFFQSLGPKSHNFLNMMEWLGNQISQYIQDPGMYVIWPHRPVHIQSHEMISNLLVAYGGRDLAPPILRIMVQGHERCGTANEEWSIEHLENLSLVYACCNQFSHFMYQRQCNLLALFLLTNVPVRPLVIWLLLSAMLVSCITVIVNRIFDKCVMSKKCK